MLAPVQSGAPFGAAAQSSWPDTPLVAGSRATVPAASPTPLARSPAALVVAPSVSPAPHTPSDASNATPAARTGRRRCRERERALSFMPAIVAELTQRTPDRPPWRK